MHKFDIDIKNLSKIEGHTHLSVKVREGKVVEAKLKVSENNRFFREALLGESYKTVPNKMSRVCGTCSAAHQLCSIEAIEKAFGVKVTEQTVTLRRLLMNGQHLRDHAMHLYFFCLPDVFGVDSVFDFSDKYHSWIHDGLDVKDAGTYLSSVIGGRAVHPPYAVVGGFSGYPKAEEIKESVKKLKGVRGKILKLIEVFYNDKTIFSRKTNYVGMVNENYNYIEGKIKTSKGGVIEEKDYGEHFEKVVLPYSTSNAFTWESKEYMVGSLARINVNMESLHKSVKRDCAKYLEIFPSDNVFHNNLAQAIECLQAVEVSIELLKGLKIKEEKPLNVVPKKGEGVGVVEAPRGTLYYKLGFDKSGKVLSADLCIPTEQNVIHIEKDLKGYVEGLLKKGLSRDEISLECEKLIRAYDPCMSCATHFLKIDWD